MSMRLLRAGLPGLAIAHVPLTQTAAHEIVGNRFFPATLGIDDPGVTMSYRFRPWQILTPATIRRSDNVIFRGSFRNGSPRRLRYRLDLPSAASRHLADRPGWAQAD